MDSRIASSAIRVAATMAASESRGGVVLPGENLDVIAMQVYESFELYQSASAMTH